MILTHDECYKAVMAQDARFDGVFYTAVKTTKIYCRPICKVKAPKSENCTFYESAEQAEANGFRPCLRCRPELAPAYSEYKQRSEIVKQVLECIQDQQYGSNAVEECSKALDISPRHLHRTFKDELGVSPMQYIMTRRLLLAKSLLTDTNLRVGDIALTSGFGSASRFNAAFKKHYRMTPTGLRKNYLDSSSKDALTLKIGYRPPYDHVKMLHFFKQRAVKGIEWVSDDLVYRRSYAATVNEESYKGWIQVVFVPEKNLVECTMSRSLIPIAQHVLNKVRRVFDLDLSPEHLPEGIMKGVRLPGCFDGFEMSTRAILGQQITVKAAHTIAGRVVEYLGEDLETPWSEINKMFPKAERIFDIGDRVFEVLGPLGVIKSRAAAIQALAEKLVTGSMSFEKNAQPQSIRESLLSIKGIGVWTADYLTMRAMSWPDIFLQGDAGVRHALMDSLKDDDGNLVYDIERASKKGVSKASLQKKFEKAAIVHAEAFRPWRSYYTLSLWQSLSNE